MGEVAFERYRRLSLIGPRGVGKVCSVKAHETVIDGGVVITALPTEPGTEPGNRQRFHCEAHSANRFAEPHITPIRDTGDIDGQPYLVLPIVDGIDVHDLLQRNGPMNPRRAVGVIEWLACAQPQGFAKNPSRILQGVRRIPIRGGGPRAATSDKAEAQLPARACLRTKEATK